MSPLRRGDICAFCIPLVWISILLLLHPAASWALSPQEVFSVSARSVAALEVLDDAEKPIGVYSATQIDARRFVSVCDVLDMAHAVRLSLMSVVLNGKITARDRERNLCLIEVGSAPSQGITQHRQVPTVGSRVFAVSNALGLGVGISEGVVSGVRHFPAGDYIQFTASISPGSEGGALVDEQGRLLGIVDYRRRDGQNVNFASFAAWIDEVEKRAANNAEQLQRFDAATALQKQEKWTDLATLSTHWHQRQPDNADALRFSLAAAKGLKNADAELLAWKELYRVNPTQPDVGVGLGQALLERGSIKEALAHAKQLVAEHQEDAHVQWLLARVQQSSGLMQEAEMSYRQALILNPWLIGAYQGLAALAQARGDSATAIAIWSRLSGLYPDVLSPRISLVQTYLAAGQAARAYSALEMLPEQDKDGALAWYWRGVVLMRLDCPEAAVQAYRKSLDKQLNDADWAWAGIGSAMVEMQRYPEAIAAMETAKKISPATDTWLYQLGVYLKDGGRPGEALEIAMALTEKAPQAPLYWRLRGRTLAALDKPLEAIPAIERSLQLAPQQPQQWEALIRVNQSVGRRQQARDAYQKLRTIDAKAAENAYRSYILPYEGDAP